jgi:hypothetical protein
MRPEDVAAQTSTNGDPPGDAADQAERLTMIMEAEAATNGGAGTPDLAYPLEDLDELIANEDADEDSSDDPLHHGGGDGHATQPAEEAAMHVLDDDGAEHLMSGDIDGDRPLTEEDATLMGIDPYEDADLQSADETIEELPGEG